MKPENLDDGNSAAAVGRSVPRANSADSEKEGYNSDPSFSESEDCPSTGCSARPPLDGPQSADADTPAQAKRRLRRGVVNIVDNDIPLGMIIPKAHLALVSAADTQGSRAASRAARVSVDVT